MTLNKQQILAAKTWPTFDFEVPMWGGSIRIRALSAGERLALAKEAGGDKLDGEAAFRFFAKVICMSVIDDEGRLVFDTEADYQLLLARDWDTLQLVAQNVMRFNGMSGDDGDTEKN